MFVGPVPKGLLVLHHCDIPICVRPDHLFLGTQKDNMQDMLKKGRENYFCKVPDEIALAIKSSNDTVKELAERYGVKYHTVWDIKYGRTRRRVA